MRREDVELLVVFRFEAGQTPSEIDRAMRLPPGEAAMIVSEWWALDKERVKEGA